MYKNSIQMNTLIKKKKTGLSFNEIYIINYSG